MEKTLGDWVPNYKRGTSASQQMYSGTQVSTGIVSGSLLAMFPRVILDYSLYLFHQLYVAVCRAGSEGPAGVVAIALL